MGVGGGGGGGEKENIWFCSRRIIAIDIPKIQVVDLEGAQGRTHLLFPENSTFSNGQIQLKSIGDMH